MSCVQNGCKPSTNEARGKTVSPRVDILERADDFLLVADLPGVKPEDVDVSFDRGELTIHGNRSNGRAEKKDFQRSFTVAETVAADRIEAELKSGVLTVRLPKVEAVKPRKIAVTG
jgi:HSP20 family protein